MKKILLILGLILISGCDRTIQLGMDLDTIEQMDFYYIRVEGIIYEYNKDWSYTGRNSDKFDFNIPENIIMDGFEYCEEKVIRYTYDLSNNWELSKEIIDSKGICLDENESIDYFYEENYIVIRPLIDEELKKELLKK